VPHDLLPLVAVANPCYLTAAVSEDNHGQLDALAVPEVLEMAESSTAVVAGPGLGRGAGTHAVVRALVNQVAAPLVLDADALNVLKGETSILKHRQGPIILTPHPGEFARLTQRDIASVQSDREGLAMRFAAEHRVTLVLKGAGTIVTDGQRGYVNTTGNPGMATGGTGDVLAGLIGALLGQGLDAFAAAQVGVFLHGKAGDLAAADTGEISLIASDLLDYLPDAFRSLS
jgi:NAD(P)H-hydrate epimerase